GRNLGHFVQNGRTVFAGVRVPPTVGSATVGVPAFGVVSGLAVTCALAVDAAHGLGVAFGAGVPGVVVPTLALRAGVPVCCAAVSSGVASSTASVGSAAG